jgi:hypothetical protein
MRDTLYDAQFPALQILLGKGHRMTNASTSVEAWWSTYFGISQDKFAAAPLRLAALGEKPGDSRWLCADPVHLRIGPKGATLTDPALMNISAMEAWELHGVLAPMLADLGKLVISTPSQWHIQLADSASALPPLPRHLHDLIEQSAVSLLPSGEENRSWRQMMNEMQMALHAHPLNAIRSAQGKTAINGIALWGEGHAPSLPKKESSSLFSNDLIIVGAGKLAGMPTSSLPLRFTTDNFADNAGDCVVDWDCLRFPAASHDALAWRDVLQQLENDWLSPALNAMKNGNLDRITLHGFGEEESCSVTMSSLDRFRFWRKPRRLESI